MKYIRIKNLGEIEEAGLYLMGASTKANSDKIGFFGTGNKYAIACFLREGVDVKIYSGTKEIEISTEPATFGGETFQRIFVNKQGTSLTTRMGPKWGLWDAFREIISNALDEGGFEGLEVIECEGDWTQFTAKGSTTVFIDLTPELAEILEHIGDYFLGIDGNDPEELAVVETMYGRIRILQPQSEATVFYRKGIRVYHSEQRALYWYDCDFLDINESRQSPYDFQRKDRAAHALACCTEQSVVKTLLSSFSTGLYECAVNWGDSLSFSTVWKEALKHQEVCPKSLADTYLTPEDRNMYQVAPDALAQALAKEGFAVLGFGEREFELVEPPEGLDVAVEGAVQRLKAIHLIPENAELHVHFVKVYAENLVAWVRGGAVYYNIAMKESTEELIQTIYEEWLHIQGYPDGSRIFEHHLMMEVIKWAGKVAEVGVGNE